LHNDFFQQRVLLFTQRYSVAKVSKMNEEKQGIEKEKWKQSQQCLQKKDFCSTFLNKFLLLFISFAFIIDQPADLPTK